MPATQKDIAREVGVSQATVSDVLRGRPRGRVSDETRRRILETARRLAYRPNASAQALRTRQSRQIVYVTTQEADRQYGVLGEGIVGGLARVLTDRDYRLLINTAASPEQEVAALRTLASSGVCDGFILRAFEERHPAYRALADLGPPFILIGQCADPDLPSIAHDASGMVHTAARLLSERGHRRVGLLTPRQDQVYHRLIRQAWPVATQVCGLTADPWMGEGADRAEVEAVVGAWLEMPDAPTAIVCVGAPSGFGATRAAMRAHCPIGAGFDLVVADHQAMNWLYEPGTFYFATDHEAIGRRAATELLRLLDGHPSPGAIRVLPALAQL
jgi:LacI family transcriptional regulator, galactose operon repressor